MLNTTRTCRVQKTEDVSNIVNAVFGKTRYSEREAGRV